MLSSLHNIQLLSDLPKAGLAQLGVLQAKLSTLLDQLLQPKHLYISKYGHTPQLPIHFHIIPICQWVEELFWQDSRYRLLTQFVEDPACSLTDTDGTKLTLFIWREFCESSHPPAIQGFSIEQVISSLRASCLSLCY